MTIKQTLLLIISGVLLFLGIPSILFSLFYLALKYPEIFYNLDSLAEFLYLWLFVGLTLTITGTVLISKYKLAWAFHK